MKKGEKRIWILCARIRTLGISAMVSVQHIFYKILFKYRTNISKAMSQFIKHLYLKCIDKQNKYKI